MCRTRQSHEHRESELTATGSLVLRPPRHWLLRPPGVLFYVAAILTVAFGLWSASVESDGGFLLTLVIWCSLALVWGFRLVGAAIVTRLRFGMAEGARWSGIPLLGAACLVGTTTAPYDVRLSLSRSAMDQAANEIMAGGSTDRDWIGLWPVKDADWMPHGMRFIVAGCGGFLRQCGFAYASDETMPWIADPDHYGEDTYQRLDGHWFVWTRTFSFD